MATYFKGKPWECEVPDALRDEALAAARKAYRAVKEANGTTSAAQNAAGVARREVLISDPAYRASSLACHTSSVNTKYGGGGHYEAARRLRDPIGTALGQARRRAKKAGIACTVTKAELSIPAECPWLRIPLAVSGHAGAKGPVNPGVPSPDRICSDTGYVPGNVEFISCRANLLKRDANYRELSLMGIEALRRLGLEPEHVAALYAKLDWLSAEVQSRPDYPKLA